jgi:hypothetical protein
VRGSQHEQVPCQTQTAQYNPYYQFWF